MRFSAVKLNATGFNAQNVLGGLTSLNFKNNSHN